MARSTNLRSAALTAVAVVALLGCGTSTRAVVPTTAAPEVRTVVLVGDSMALEASSSLQAVLVGKVFVPLFFGGTAPCDWQQRDLSATPTTVVVLSFHGNSLSPCMANGSGGFLAASALVERYRRDLTTLIDTARRGGAMVVLVGQPVNGPSMGGDAVVRPLNALYRHLATAPGVHFVDAGPVVEGPGGSFVVRMACLPGERPCGADGTNVVRSDDGVHFCPGPAHTGVCPQYSSGAYRFSLAIAGAVGAL